MAGAEPQHAYHEDLGYYEERAGGLLASARDGTGEARAAFDRWDAPLTLAGARSVLARQHGMADWPSLAGHVATLRESGEPFAEAYRALEGRDRDWLAVLLDRTPGLVSARGTNDNDLLGMAAATGDAGLVALLLERGADPARGNAHGWTPLHQAGYSNSPALARMLLDAGAPTRVSARGDGGTPLVAALFWGHREVADVLADHGVTPLNLRVVAGLGRTDLVAELAPEGRPPAPGARRHRAFYRPHGGFPAWRPSDDPQEILDEGLAWAARSDRVECLGPLTERGARIDADVYRGTPLAWAAFRGRARAAERLIELGADPRGRTSFGGEDHGEDATALHLAAQNGHVGVIRILLAAGADPAARDAIHGGTPADWARYGGQTRALAALQAGSG
jgi:ankyrin repeat protein